MVIATGSLARVPRPQSTSGPGPGRPRRYEAEEELQLILDGAFDVMRTKGYTDLTVNDILGAAQVSTRSFYRHFASKDELLVAMFRRDAEEFAAKVRRRVAAVGSPGDALEVWIDEILGFGLDRPRATRAAVFGAPAAMRSLPPAELRRALDQLIESLIEVLSHGAGDGTFTISEASNDAVFISALAWETSNRMRDATTRQARSELRRSMLVFTRRALGMAER
jgi:AcrR family transcriptional regulator